MHHIIYMSRAASPMSDNDLEDILRQARSNNERRNITGALAYGDGQFMQIIEGSKEALDSVYEAVARDPRHFGLVKFADKAIRERSFSEWSMAFHTLSAPQFEQLVGYITPRALSGKAHNMSAADDLLFQMMGAFGHTQRP